MKVRMREQILGTRNGVRWPAPGEVKNLPDGEAAELIVAGIAEQVDEPSAAEVARPRKATARKAEKRG